MKPSKNTQVKIAKFSKTKRKSQKESSPQNMGHKKSLNSKLKQVYCKKFKQSFKKDQEDVGIHKKIHLNHSVVTNNEKGNTVVTKLKDNIKMNRKSKKVDLEMSLNPYSFKSFI